MDTRDGRIYEAREVLGMSQEDRQHMQPMAHGPSLFQRLRQQIALNDPCPCGSRKKFKKCCLFKSPAEPPINSKDTP
jgi:uncharacterized protein YecA (UPF0149 family)